MTDDIYEHLLYEGDRFSTIAAAVSELGPEQLIAAMKSLQSQSTTNPCSIAQAAAVEALTGPQTHIAKHNTHFRARRDLIVQELEAINGLSCVTPRGAFHIYPSCATFIGKRTPAG
ncbi:MAG: aminotransferase [Microvirga sp.]|nr:aminotransferase [Microvirga sp.]